MAMEFALYRFRVAPRETLFLPARNKGNVLRGALGAMLREICCDPACPGAARCQRRATCPYAQVFEPAPPPGAPALSNYVAIPRPFVIRAPLEEKTRYAAGEPLDFELVLAGRIVELLPWFQQSFERLAESGFGLNRARCALESAERVEIAQPEYARARPAAPPQTGQIAVRFLTPTHLVFGGQTVREPEFHHLFRRLRDRMNALSTFYCGAPLPLDFKGLGERAEKVACVGRDLRWEERERRSSRTGMRHPIGGLLGECAYAGELAEFLPLLWLGQYLHVGKHAAWGNGRLELLLGPEREVEAGRLPL
jgi:CRISPR/Cas system endoribonuclease Cas6 (RAMP superfamily)